MVRDPNEGFLINDNLSIQVQVTNLSDIEYWLFLLTCFESHDVMEGVSALFQLSYTSKKQLLIIY